MKKLSWLQRGLAVLVPLGIALVFSSCNSTPVTASSDAGAKIVTKDYELVKVTGSHIPIRVPTSPTAKALPTSEPLQTISGDSFRDAMASREGPFN